MKWTVAPSQLYISIWNNLLYINTHTPSPCAAHQKNLLINESWYLNHFNVSNFFSVSSFLVLLSVSSSKQCALLLSYLLWSLTMICFLCPRLRFFFVPPNFAFWFQCILMSSHQRFPYVLFFTVSLKNHHPSVPSKSMHPRPPPTRESFTDIQRKIYPSLIIVCICSKWMAHCFRIVMCAYAYILPFPWLAELFTMMMTQWRNYDDNDEYIIWQRSNEYVQNNVLRVCDVNKTSVSVCRN